MSVSANVNKASVRKAIKAISLFTDRKSDAIRAQVATSALAIDRTAKQLVPVDTGRLRGSIHPIFSNQGLDAQVVTNVEYAAAVEFGTRYQRAQPYLFPAAEQERQKFLAAMKRILSTK